MFSKAFTPNTRRWKLQQFNAIFETLNTLFQILKKGFASAQRASGITPLMTSVSQFLSGKLVPPAAPQPPLAAAGSVVNQPATPPPTSQTIPHRDRCGAECEAGLRFEMQFHNLANYSQLRTIHTTSILIQYSRFNGTTYRLAKPVQGSIHCTLMFALNTKSWCELG